MSLFPTGINTSSEFNEPLIKRLILIAIHRYLFIRRPAFMTLAKRNPDVFSTFNAKDLSGQRIENLPDLQGLFPDLSVLFLRRPDQCRWFQNPDGERDIDTACQAIIYEPIKLSTVVSAAVMDIDRRHTQFAANDIGFARNATGLDYWFTNIMALQV
jgi:hypothetical protein